MQQARRSKVSASLAINLHSNRRTVTDRARSTSMRIISMTAEIKADRTQLKYALTLPEYLEAWLTPADSNWNHERTVLRAGTGYVIEYSDLEGQTVIVDGVFRAAAPDRIVLTWCRQWPRKTRRSRVSIGLSGSGGSTTLSIAHAGVMADEEYRWLCDLWDLSLIRLKSLFELGRSNAFETPVDRAR
jgi:uncharacterized protein YndB with AHSA1/START domain